MKKKVLLFLALVLSLVTVGLVVDANPSTVDVYVTSIFDNDASVATELKGKTYGSKLQITPITREEYEFDFWIVNGVVREQYPQDHEFVVTSNMNLQAVFHKVGNVSVVFIDSNGKLIDKQFFAPGGNAINPITKEGINLPSKPMSVIDNVTPWRTLENSTSLSNITKSTVFVLQYRLTNDNLYTVTYDAGNGETQITANLNEVVTLVANSSKDSQLFSHWVDENGQILSTKQVYSFSVFGDVSVNAVFNNTKLTGPVVNMTNAKSIRDSYKSYVAQFELPLGCEFVESGFVFSRSSMELTKESLGATVVYSSNYNRATGEFLMSFPQNNHNSIRAFVTYVDGEGSHIVYSGYNEKKIEHINTNDKQLVTGFNNSEGFSTSDTNYQKTSTFGNPGSQWEFYYALPSTGKIIEGDRSAQIRLYTNGNKGYISSLFSLVNPSSIEFTASNNDDKMDIIVEISSDDGSSWKNDQSFDIKTNDQIFEYKFGESGNYRVRFRLNTTLTVNSSNKQLYLDNINVIYKTDSKIEYNNHSEVVYIDGSSYVTNFIENNTNLQFPQEPTKDYYNFDGWYLENTFNTRVDSNYTVNQSMKLYAKWSPKEYTITFNSNGGSEVLPLTTNFGSAISKPSNPTRLGYTFENWYVDKDYNNLFEFNTMPHENVTLYAKWIPNKYTISFESNGGSEVLPITQDVGTSITIPENPTYNGYFFGGWYSDPECTTPYVFSLMPAENITLYALWLNEVEEFEVTFDVDGVDTQIVEMGKLATRPVDPTRSGFVFVGWFIDKELTAVYDFNEPVFANLHLYAKWLKIYTVTFSYPGIDSQNIIEGNLAIEPINPVNGESIFGGWYSDEEYLNLFDFNTTINYDITLYPLWVNSLVLYKDLLGTTGNAPAGWVYTGLGSKYADNSLKMDTSNDSITTESFSLLMNAVFIVKVRGNGTSNSYITFYDQNNTQIYKSSNLTSDKTYNIEFNLNSSITRVKMVYTKSSGNAGIYEVTIKYIP